MLNPYMIDNKPHWQTPFPEELWPAFEDFRNFLAIVWHHLGLPQPTEAQYEIAHRLQYGYDTAEAKELDSHRLTSLFENPREDIVRCFRGAGKSYITSAFAIWRLMRNPRDEKILVVSAAGSKAKEFVSQTKGIISSMPILQWLIEGAREKGAARRDQADQFDVSGSSLSQSYSVAARGITSQITGSRATLLIADDIEVEKNSLTEEARQRIVRVVQSDFVPITKTEHGKGDIILLGTPQTEESIYNVLVKAMQFRTFTIPVRYPSVDKLKNYVLRDEETGEDVNILAPYLIHKHDQGLLEYGGVTDTRFGHDEMVSIESKGRATYALQYMLDTSLSDAERYPLRQFDLVVFSTNPVKAPLQVQWGRDSDKKNQIRDISNLGFSGDHFLRPLFTDTDWESYDGTVLFVDPAGRGKDETAWAIVATLNGIMYVLHVGGLKGDPAEAMQQIAVDAKRFSVNVVEVEPNYGQGLWVTSFGPILQKVWPGGCTIQESEWAKGHKEGRIIDTLEPVMTQHRLVMDEALIRSDVKSTDHVYSLMYQLTHITRDRGCLKHDDRVDALAGAVAYWQKSMGQSVDEARQGVLDSRWEQEIEDFMEMAQGGFAGRELGSNVVSIRGRRRADGSRSVVTQRDV